MFILHFSKNNLGLWDSAVYEHICPFVTVIDFHIAWCGWSAIWTHPDVILFSARKTLITPCQVRELAEKHWIYDPKMIYGNISSI